MLKLVKSTFYREDEVKQALSEFLLQAEILSMAEQCLKFEQAFSQKQNRKFSIFVNSGSSANLILIQSLLNLGRLEKGDKVGVSSLTWSTNVMPILQLGLVPVAIDCEKETLNISSRTVSPHLKDIKCLFVTNALGFCGDLDKIAADCGENNVLLLEDNCESLGSEAFGKKLGNFGAASTFSFFVGHHLSTIEGGMVCTDDEELKNMLTMCRAHGWDRNLPQPVQAGLRNQFGIDDFYAKYTFFDLAFGVRPTEIQGFVGNAQLGYWDEIVGKRQDNFLAFQKTLNLNPDFYPLETGHMKTISNFAVPIVCKNIEAAEKYKKNFLNAQVEIRPVIAGDITRQPFYKKYASAPAPCPNASLTHENGFYFPNNPELSGQEIELLNSLITP